MYQARQLWQGLLRSHIDFHVGSRGLIFAGRGFQRAAVLQGRAQAMARWKRKSVGAEMLIAVVVGFFVCAMINWTFRSFALLIYVTAVSTVAVLIASWRRGLVGFAMAAVPLSVCLIAITWMLPTVFPFQMDKLSGARYVDATLVSVLADLALEKDDAPTWRFQIATRELAEKTVSIEIPNEARLGNVLNRIAAATDAKLEWQWHKMSGNEPEPLCAVFSFRPNSSPEAAVPMPAVTVSQHGTFWSETTRGVGFTAADRKDRR
jgi:hypothetical protein